MEWSRSIDRCKDARFAASQAAGRSSNAMRLVAGRSTAELHTVWRTNLNWNAKRDTLREATPYVQVAQAV